MAFCEHCSAQIDGRPRRQPEPWFNPDRREIAGFQLPRKPWQVFEILWERLGKYVSRESFMTLLYGEDDDTCNDRVLDIYIMRIRERIAYTPYRIETIYGVGWMLHKPGEEDHGIEVRLGPTETGIDLPRLRRRPATDDKYGLRALKPGESRIIEGASPHKVRDMCNWAKRHDWGRFEAAVDERGALRIWRLQ